MSDTKTHSLKARDGDLQVAGHFTTQWDYVLPAEYDYEDCKNPAFWSIVSKRMKTDDIIHVRTQDQRFFAQLYVLHADRTQVVVKEMMYQDLQDKNAPEIPDDAIYDYAWKGPAWGHTVIRKSDSEVMAKNLGSKADALRWIAVNSKNAA